METERVHSHPPISRVFYEGTDILSGKLYQGFPVNIEVLTEFRVQTVRVTLIHTGYLVHALGRIHEHPLFDNVKVYLVLQQNRQFPLYHIPITQEVLISERSGHSHQKIIYLPLVSEMLLHTLHYPPLTL